jgi:hypothetical protein
LTPVILCGRAWYISDVFTITLLARNSVGVFLSLSFVFPKRPKFGFSHLRPQGWCGKWIRQWLLSLEVRELCPGQWFAFDCGNDVLGFSYFGSIVALSHILPWAGWKWNKLWAPALASVLLC